MRKARASIGSRSAGRPPKFREPRRPVTVTLPERTLLGLERIDPDRARAIVKATETALNQRSGDGPLVALVEVAPGASLIVIGHSRSLTRIAGVRLAELAPGRFIVTVPPGTSVDSLELALADLVDDIPVGEEAERQIIQQLCRLLHGHRRSRSLSKVEILVIDTGKAPATP